jgi:hypothetical protein
MNASEKGLEESGESCERWGGFGAGLVVLGVAAEIAIAAAHPPYDSFWEQWGSTVANSLVAIGVAIEVQFGRMGHRRQSELQRRTNEKLSAATKIAGEANARAAEAQLELLQFRAPRLPSPEQLAVITEALRGFAGTSFDSGLARTSGEQADFWWILQPAIVAAGWNHVRWSGTGDIVRQGNRPWSGDVGAKNVEIHIHPESRSELEAAAAALVAVLNKIGIAVHDVGFNSHSGNTTAIHIMIGEKT